MKFIKPLKAFGIVTVKKSAIAPKTFDAASFTASHTAMTLFLKSSLVAKSVTNAATSAATTVITMPIGLAAITVFKIFCAMVMPSVVAFHTFIAATSPCIIVTTFHANIPAAIPTIIEIICVPFLDIKEIKSFVSRVCNVAYCKRLAVNSILFPYPISLGVKSLKVNS